MASPEISAPATAARLRTLRQSLPAILPSMLLCDFGNLAAEIRRLEDAGAKCIHLDVMDGHFVPNCTYGMTIVEACRKLTDLPLDVHLMISNPAQYLKSYRDAGADLLTIHIEAVPDPAALLDEMHALGVDAGLALNPPTPLSAIEPFLKKCDLVLAMSVMPGFGGQSFNTVALEKLAWLRDWSLRENHPLLLEVDGGVNDATIQSCGRAGATLHVVGSGIFKHSDYGRAIADLTALAAS
ncbi:MAG: ribulose-phosphate 3-epimerase [Pirellulales bacterium]